MDVLDGETNTTYVGAENGTVAKACPHAPKDHKTGIVETFTGHDGYTTTVSCHPRDLEGEDFGDLLLTGSVDWTVKLWSQKKAGEPLLSMEVYDEYVTDVKWHPQHPAVFACTDGEGHVDLWNLNKDLENPWFRIDQKAAVHKVDWSCDGT